MSKTLEGSPFLAIRQGGVVHRTPFLKEDNFVTIPRERYA
jgi:hypothetical protein